MQVIATLRMCPTCSFCAVSFKFPCQAHSNGRFWLKESKFGLNKWFQACFWKTLPPKPASSIQLKSFMFGRLLTGILHKKGWPANPESKDWSETSHFSKLAWGNSWKLAHCAVKTRGSRSSSKGSCLNVTAPVNISNGKKCSHQSPNPKFSWKSAFPTAFAQNVQTVLMAQHSHKDCGHLRNFLSKHVFCNVFCIFSMVGDPSNITLSTACIPKADWAQCPLMRLDLYRLFTWNNHVIQSFKPCLKKKTESL